jgi:hypothetical protein
MPCRRQVDSEKRANTGNDIGHEEIQPVKRVQAAAAAGTDFFHTNVPGGVKHFSLSQSRHFAIEQRLFFFQFNSSLPRCRPEKAQALFADRA